MGEDRGLSGEEGYRMRKRVTDIAQVTSASLSYCPDLKLLEIFAQNKVSPDYFHLGREKYKLSMEYLAVKL